MLTGCFRHMFISELVSPSYFITSQIVFLVLVETPHMDKIYGSEDIEVADTDELVNKGYIKEKVRSRTYKHAVHYVYICKNYICIYWLF